MTSALPIPDGYGPWLRELKSRIQGARTRALLAVNAEQIQLYHEIGRELLARRDRDGWGAKVVDRLAADLRDAFPDMRGFSARNLKYMRYFAECCPDGRIGQQPAAHLPWFHLVMLLAALKDDAARAWYASAAVANGWSRDTLVAQIRSEAHRRDGAALTNFARQLPEYEAEMVQALVEAREYEPADAGQRSFYLAAVHAQMEAPDDKPTIGLLLCRRHNKVVAEYALSGMAKPIGVADYQLVRALPDPLERSLPSIEEIEAELSADLARIEALGEEGGTP